MSALTERAREEYEALALVGTHGTNRGGWFADLTIDDVADIMRLIRDLAHALERVEVGGVSAREGQPPAPEALIRTEVARVRRSLVAGTVEKYSGTTVALRILDVEALLALVAARERDAATLREALAVMELYLDSCEENDEAPLTSTLRAMLGVLAAAAPADELTEPDQAHGGSLPDRRTPEAGSTVGRRPSPAVSNPAPGSVSAPADEPAGDA